MNPLTRREEHDGAAPVPSPAPEEGADPAVDADADLERAVARVSTVLSDVTHGVDPDRSRPLAEFAAFLIDDLPRRAEALEPAAVRDLAERVRHVGGCLERYAAGGASGAAAPERLGEVLRDERQGIERLLSAAGAGGGAAGA